MNLCHHTHDSKEPTDSSGCPTVLWEPLEARLLLNADLTGMAPTSLLEAPLGETAIQIDLPLEEQYLNDNDPAVLCSYSVTGGVSTSVSAPGENDYGNEADSFGAPVAEDAYVKPASVTSGPTDLHVANANDMARMTQFLGSDDYEILDTWRESRRTPGGTSSFRMYKVSTGQYLAIDEQNGAVYDSEALATLTSAANEALSPIDKISPVLRQIASEWGLTRLVTLQLALPAETMQLVRSAFDTGEMDEQAASAYGNTETTSAGYEQDVAAQLNLRLAALKVQETAYTGIIDGFLQRNRVPTEDAAGEKIVYRYLYAPAVALNATWEECLAFAADPGVVAIHPELQFQAENERSVAAARTTSAWASGLNGTGAVIAHVEDGRMETANPYLSATVRPGTYAVANHATACGGIIRSTHAFFQGHASGCTLLSAAAGSWNQTDLVAATEWAVQQGAMVINCSFGLNSTGEFTWSDVYFDFLSANSQVLITKSAGNEGTASGYVTSPGKGYNVFTVGNIDGGTSPGWTDDTMHDTSSYLNPESGGEKPEVAMYGTNIYTTGASSPWVGNQGTGTSYAAPAVAAFAGLCIDDHPTYSDDPCAVKAQIMTSAVVHNIEGVSWLSQKDGAGAALGTACNAGALAVTLGNASFDSSGYWEYTTDILLHGGRTNRIVLCYFHVPITDFPATPGPEDYYKTDLDLRLFVGGSQVASSAYGTQQPFEIIDYTPAADTIARIKVYRWSWNSNIASLRIGIAYGSSYNFGTTANAVNDDAYEENDTSTTAAPVGAGSYTQLRLSDQDWYRIAAPAYSQVTCNISFDHSIGDLDLMLYETDGITVGVSRGYGDSESVSGTNTSAAVQYYDLVVYGKSDARNVYDMQIAVTSLPQVTVLVSPSSVLEDGTANLLYTFTRLGPTTSPLAVNFSVAGTATYNTDYTQTGATSFNATSGTMTIPAGQIWAQVTVNPTADTTVEPNETVILTVTTGTGYWVGTPAAATGTIQNDDAAPATVTVAVAPSSVPEDGAANLVYTLARTGATSSPLTVNLAVDGSATYNTDYTQTGAINLTSTLWTVTIPVGQSVAQVTVAPTPDTTVEPDETVILTVTAGTGYTVGTPFAATGTIQNDDAAPATVTLTVAPSSVQEDGSTNLVYTFTRTGTTSSVLAVNFSIGGTATYATDYTQTGATTFSAVSGAVTIPAGQATAQVTVNPTADTAVEADETVILMVTTGTGYTVGTPSAATGTILNDDVTPVMVTAAVAPSSVPEDGAANLVYTFTRTGAMSSPLTVNLVVGGTAIYNTDYTQTGAVSLTSTSWIVTIPVGQSATQVTVDPTVDTAVEPDETVILTVAAGTGYTVGIPSAATGTILNDDSAPSNLALNRPAVASTSYVGLPPSNATDGNTGTRWSSQFSDNQWIYVDLGSVYTLNQVVLRWEAAYGRAYRIQVSNDASTWSDAYSTTTGDGDVDDIPLAASGRYVRMLGTQRGTIYGYSLWEFEVYGGAVGTLVSVAVSPSSVPEDGAGNLVYTFTRSAASTNALAVNFSVGGTATFNTDYTQTGATSFNAGSGTVTIPAGQTTAQVTINPTADTTVEPNETVILTVAAGTGYTVGIPSAATGTILNDDGAPSNLALNRPAVASTSYPGLPPSNATDGNGGTRWSSQFSDSQWIYVDLGSVYALNQVVLRWEAAYGRAYRIQVSNDASYWSDAYSTTTGDGGVDDITLAATGRYVRMLGTQRGTIYGYSLWEFEVYGSGPPNTPEIMVLDNGISIADGDTTPSSTDGTDFGSVAPGATPIRHTFTVRNDGLATLTLGTLTLPTGFTLTEGLSSSLAAGASDTFTVQLDTAALGPKTGDISFATNDSDENPFNFRITGTVTDSPPTNLALNQPIVASSSYAGLPPSNATDGNGGTRWSSQFSDSQWIYVDLGSVYALNQVVLRWEAAYGRAYRIQVSNDASTWSDAYSTTTGDGGVDDITLAATGRYVRMLGTQRGTIYGYSLWEFEVYGEPVTNLALGRPATASTSYPGLPPSNATDGNPGTRWSSEFSDSQWIYVDLGSVYTINQIVLRWETAYGRGYQIQVSSNASTWSTVYSTTTGDGGVDDIRLGSPVSARYVRLLGTQRGTIYGYSLWEFEVYA